MKDLYDVVIVGGGPAGLTAALYLARAKYRVVVLEKEQFGGQVTITSEVVNYPGVFKTDGKGLTETMKEQAESFGAEFIMTEADRLEVDGDIKKVHTGAGVLSCFGILIATGANPRMVGFKGESEFKGHGVAYCATCDGEFFSGKDIFVIGGGYAAAQESIFLTKYAKHVTILMRGDDFSCAKSMADAVKSNENITVMTNVQVQEVDGDKALKSLKYKDLKTGKISEYKPDDEDTFGVFVFAGYEPETELAEGIVDLDEHGYIKTDMEQKTNIEGIYAAGDVCIKNLRQVVTAVGDGAIAATELERYAASMQEKTGMKPEISQKSNVKKDSSSDLKNSAYGNFEQSNSDFKGENKKAIFSDEIIKQLDSLFSKMKKPLILKLFLDKSEVAGELRAYAEEMASLTDKINVSIEDEVSEEEELPCVRIFMDDGTNTGLAFHGFPGGHEFTSFILGLYNVSGPGQEIEENIQKRIDEIKKPVNIQIMVSLSCSMCPESVVSAQKIAAENSLVRAEIYDVNLYPEIKEKYSIMSVPCMVINDGEPVFGRKNISQILDLI